MAGVNFLGLYWAHTLNLDGMKTLLGFLGVNSEGRRPAEAKAPPKIREPSVRRVQSTHMAQTALPPVERDKKKLSMTLPACQRNCQFAKPASSDLDPLSFNQRGDRKRLKRLSLRSKVSTPKASLRLIRNKFRNDPVSEIDCALTESGDKPPKTQSLPRKIVYLRLNDKTIVRPGIMQVHKETTV